MIFTFKKTLLYDYLSAIAAILLVMLLIYSPKTCTAGALAGLKLSANILVPSLFPFAVPVIFLIGTGAFKNSKHKILILYLLSLIGGYPIGAKLIKELKNRGIITATDAENLLPFCVNAGPAFIVLAVGAGILKSKSIGYILLFSHIASSVVFMLAFNRKLLFTKAIAAKRQNGTPAFDNFVYSVHSASEATLNICSFVVLFSVIGAYTDNISSSIPLSAFLNLIEITTAISKTRNVYFISFMLGFAGLCVWMQVLSQIKANIFKFTVLRTAQGTLSALITMFIIRRLNIAVPAVSNTAGAHIEAINSGYTLAFSMLVMVILLLVSISSKNHTGNLLKDMV